MVQSELWHEVYIKGNSLGWRWISKQVRLNIGYSRGPLPSFSKLNWEHKMNWYDNVPLDFYKVFWVNYLIESSQWSIKEAKYCYHLYSIFEKIEDPIVWNALPKISQPVSRAGIKTQICWFETPCSLLCTILLRIFFNSAPDRDLWSGPYDLGIIPCPVSDTLPETKYTVTAK